MKKTLLKDCFKEIKNTYKRFISILLMAFLGVGFFAGVRSTSPDMVDTIDKYYKNQNVYDIQVMSTLGLTSEDIEEIKKVENVDEVIGTYETDGSIEIDNKEVIAKVLCVEDINKPELVEGRLPENENECVVEKKFLTANNKQIGDTIELKVENTTNDDGEEIAYLKQTNLKIVGTVNSPMYISRDRGNSSLGTGKINYYLYISKDNINAKAVFASAYIKVKDSNKYTTSTDKYKETVENVENAIEEIKDERENKRQEDLKQKATEKVTEAEAEYNSKKQEAEEEIANAKKEIEDGYAKIETSEEEIANNEKKANTEFANAEKEIENAKIQITQGENELITKENDANAKFAEFESQKNTLQGNLKTIEIGLNIVNSSYTEVIKKLENPDLTEEERVKLETEKATLETQKAGLEANKNKINECIAQIDSGIASGKQELENAKKEIENEKIELESQEKTLKNTKITTYAKIYNAKQKIENSKQELKDGEQELLAQEEEANKQLAEAEAKLIDAKAKIADIEKPTWYILDRDSNVRICKFYPRYR